MKFLLLCLAAPLLLPAEDSSVLQLLQQPGHIALVRHALAPGTGDPDDFDLKDCSTQRNLSEYGRSQAKAMGENYRNNGIDEAYVFTSQWCRCKDTASLLGFENVTERSALNSFFARPSVRDPQMKELRTWLNEDLPQNKPVILVTHQVVITALTGIFPASGETIVIRETENGWEVVGSVK